MAEEVTLDRDYTYESSGLDDFLMRQQEILSPLNEVTSSGELNFDDQQIGGAMAGNLNMTGVMTVGNIRIDGDRGRISVMDDEKEIITIDGADGNMTASDGNKRRLVIGRFPNSEYGLAVSKEGYDVISEALGD